MSTSFEAQFVVFNTKAEAMCQTLNRPRVRVERTWLNLYR